MQEIMEAVIPQVIIAISAIAVCLINNNSMLKKVQLENQKTKEEVEEKQKEGEKAIKEGVQALLRDRLYQLFFYCSGRGFTTIEERENFEFMYKQYHGLGANGVMDSIKEKFESLPLKN